MKPVDTRPPKWNPQLAEIRDDHSLESQNALWRGLINPPVVAWMAHVVIVLAVVVGTVTFTNERDPDPRQRGMLGQYVVSPLDTWDGGWYVLIAQHGYDRQPSSAAFWPLYPMLLDIGHLLSGLNHATVGVMISNVVFLPALIAMFVLVRADYGPAIAKRAVWLAALSPLAFFFSAVYTEALFLVLTVSALALGRSGRWTLAALAAALATLTRNSGILVLLPLALMLIEQRGWHPRSWWPRGIQLGAAALTPLAFGLHLDRIWGDPLLTVRAQEEWGRGASTPWETLIRAYHMIGGRYLGGIDSCDFAIDSGVVDRCRGGLQITVEFFSDDLSIVAVTAVLLLLPYAIRRLLPRDSLYLLAGFTAPLLNPTDYDPLHSMARYLLVLFPIYIAVAFLLRWRPLFVATIAGSTVALCGFLYLFAQRYFVA